MGVDESENSQDEYNKTGGEDKQLVKRRKRREETECLLGERGRALDYANIEWWLLGRDRIRVAAS